MSVNRDQAVVRSRRVSPRDPKAVSDLLSSHSNLDNYKQSDPSTV